jgi:hypothetical protein
MGLRYELGRTDPTATVCSLEIFFRGAFRSRNSFRNNWTGLSLKFAHLHTVIFLSNKFHQNPLDGSRGVAKTMFKGQTDDSGIIYHHN